MTRLDSRPRSLTLPSTARLDPSVAGQRPQPAHWLIVLVPHFDIDSTAAARRIWELASAMDARVLFLGLYGNAIQELSLRRRLATMSAIVNDGRVFAEAEVIFGNDWVEITKSRIQADDMVVCFAEQRVGWFRQPLSQVLQSYLDAPLYILAGLYSQNDSRLNWPVQIAAWTGSIAIILGFFMLQVRAGHLSNDLARITLQLLSIPIEVWVIWVWNTLFR